MITPCSHLGIMHIIIDKPVSEYNITVRNVYITFHIENISWSMMTEILSYIIVHCSRNETYN